MEEKGRNRELVSIIVPVYNVEKYIEQCINSLISQTYKNLEIIVVNDGSPDNSEKKIKKIAQKDERVKLITQKNAGVSAARNNGIKEAKGEYIIFVDADDYLASDYVQYMLELIQQSNCEFAYSINNYWAVGEKQTNKIIKKIVSSDESVGLLLSPDVTVGCWNKIYRREFIESNKLFFREDLYYGEGLNFIIRASLAANKVGVGNKKVYYYRKNNLSSATTKYSVEKYNNGEKSLKLIGDMVNLENEYIRSMYYLHLSTFCLGALVKLMENKKTSEYEKEYLSWRNQVKLNLNYLLKNKYVSVYRKAMLLVGAIFPRLIVILNRQREKEIIKKSVK